MIESRTVKSGKVKRSVKLANAQCSLLFTCGAREYLRKFFRQEKQRGSYAAKLLQKSEMRKDIVIELSYKGFG